MSLLTVPGGDWRLKAPTVRDAMGSLVTQLTANPDITKFSLPAVFLYPYTVLELGAFRALRYQSFLLKLREIKDPLERLLQVTRWFLTCMEQMDSMSKKPFNPVLGEELNAWGDHPQCGRTIVKAEQVSHHPPVSALTMRNDQSKLQFNSNVKFGITFHGNSVSCKLQGRAEVVLEELGESYVAPNWVPDILISNVLFGTRRQSWIGTWSMECAKSGYGVELKASDVNVNSGWFSAAARAGNYENVLEGFVYKLSDPDKTPVKEFSGHVGRKIFVQDAGKEKTRKLFIDCEQLELEKISFLPENLRPPNSSLVMWKSTVAALVADDNATADKEKSIVENQQRQIRKDREAEGGVFVPQYFTFDQESDSFRPLPKAFELVSSLK